MSNGKKEHSGIRRGGSSKALAKSQAELKATQKELEDTRAQLQKLQDDYDDLLKRVMSVSDQLTNTDTKPKANSKYAEPTQANFKSAFDELHKFREFPRIPDLRRELGWSQSEFDNMIRVLRDNRTIQIFRADESMMTRDEIQDCFFDENGTPQGILIWNRR